LARVAGGGGQRRAERVTRDARHFLQPLLEPRSDSFAAVLSIAAIAIALVLGLLLGPERHADRFGPGLVVSGALVVTRYLALRLDLGAWIVPLDAIACVVVVAWTSAPLSEFHFVVLAGIWWAGRLTPRRGAALFAASFLVPYALIVLPDGWQRGYLAEAADDLLTVAVIALLVDWYMAVDRRAMALSTAMRTGEAREESPIEIRRRLALAAGDSPLPVDTLVIAGQLGLTANQIELLSYILLGFGNAQIADAIGRSEATVRYRLTRLYRDLDVSGRRGAIERARDLGLDSMLSRPGRS
jgi:DNA-binding CsgD family transcriptional regulator